MSPDVRVLTAGGGRRTQVVFVCSCVRTCVDARGSCVRVCAHVWMREVRVFVCAHMCGCERPPPHLSPHLNLDSDPQGAVNAELLGGYRQRNPAQHI